MNLIFHNFDFSQFWDDIDYYKEEYTGTYPDDKMIAEAEQELGFKLPASYIELIRNRNGGAPVNKCHFSAAPTSWSGDHVAITGIFGIDPEKDSSVYENEFWIEEWGYPADGIYICDCPSAGHDMILLDYSQCGPQGEPMVVHVDQENDYQKTFLAPNFESFIRGLKHEDFFHED
ncbi:SMI1/KNR4 family protein [Pseudoflavitalea sp. G-6-1-2]|uniref:SMI1/KNR4 family protein n=1 Tax=Pseudoflavitalea sp. G-6-1-2 TaxID=2728841 RepID=UPI001469FACE|nr:SMI1/KNR4 family protein [Pseudoflavitalea sp. G-6-1-2]NML22050.1 SMI1/KNR4 family protein [Pseudoflavitalea sp. G-6-1-2]